MESYNPRSNAAEREIEDLMKGASHKLLWSRALAMIWGDCPEFEAYIRSNMAHNIYKLDEEVPKMTVKCPT